MNATTAQTDPTLSRIKARSLVLFEYRGDVETGNVTDVEEEPEGRMVSILWLDGYRSRSERIPATELLALYDRRCREIKVGSFVGRGKLLPAGKRWLDRQAPTS